MSNPRKEIHDKIWKVMKKNPSHPSSEDHLSLRTRIWNVVEHDHGKAGTVVNWFLFGVILISLLVLPLDFIPAFQEYRVALRNIEVFITIVFTAEYFLRIFASPRPVKYIFSWWGLIDLLGTLPFYFILLSPSALATRYLGLFRVLRIFKILHVKSLDEIERRRKDQTSLSGVMSLIPGEKIEKVALNHPIFFVLNLILPITLGAVGMGVMFAGNFQGIMLGVGIILLVFMSILLYNSWLDYYYDVLYVTNYRVIFQDKHLFGQNINQVEYRSITNIRPSDSGIWSSLFGFGKIIIETSNEQGTIEDKHIRDFENVAHLIQRKCYEFTERQTWKYLPKK